MPPRPVPSQGPPAWTALDEYLWHTCEIVADVVQGQLDRRPLVATVAPLPSGDRALATGPARSYRWRALGNGSYHHNQVVAAGPPAFVIGSLLGAAVGNSSRRREAARNAQPRWVAEVSGEVTVSREGAFIVHPVRPAGSVVLYWSGLDFIDLVAPDVFQTTYISTANNQVAMRIATPWASLMFALAALTRFPAHPRLLGRGWLPPGFEQRSAAIGRPCRPAADLVLGGGGT
ncbi:hypothetical protein [Streptomyces roseolus]|uniref:hypothetical protein n=1 Tax=Streptomyces roseolus TaxID=67358 RepID=UPI00167B803B|nr:hypothetical protein [Streptomyces roseolus]GGR64357.1 hypothetical protein GCM10010282_66740 [Streptomyces roseolus]